MIRFLSNVRRYLLSDGKFGKYMLYAVGEIVLVVIGILLALQIDTWNDEREARRAEENFFNNVLLDLAKDEENLAYYHLFHSRRIDYLDTLLTYTRNPSLTMGFEKFGQYVEPIFYSVDPASYPTTFESAKSQGTFNIFKETELLKELSQYYADFILIENTFNSLKRFVENHYEPLMYSLPESYVNENTGRLVINEEDVGEFYRKVASIPDTRNVDPDYQRVLQNPKMEFYLIGDMARTYNILGKIGSRRAKLERLTKRIEGIR